MELLGWRPMRLLLGGGVLLLTLVALFRWRGVGPVTDQLVWYIPFLAVFSVLFVGVFVVNILLAPSKIRAQRLDVIEAQLRQSEQELAAKLAECPRITVRHERPYLVVKNDGATAKFWAHLRVVACRNFTKAFKEDGYDGCWEISRSTEETVPHGRERRLWFGTVHGYSSNADSMQALALYYYSSAVGGRDEKEGEYVAVGTPPQAKPWLRVEVTFTSEPAMSERKWVRRYDLTTGGIYESE